MWFLIGLVLFVALIVFGCIADSRSEKKDKAEIDSSAKLWLDDELAKTLFKVVVIAKNGKSYESEAFVPHYTIQHYFRWTFWRYPSKELAQTKIEQSFKAGRYFHSQTDTYIPMCDIETVNVVQVD